MALMMCRVWEDAAFAYDVGYCAGMEYERCFLGDTADLF